MKYCSAGEVQRRGWACWLEEVRSSSRAVRRSVVETKGWDGRHVHCRRRNPAGDLIEPGCVGREARDRDVKAEVTHPRWCLGPGVPLCGRVSGPLVHNDDHVLHAAPERFRKDHLRNNGLDIDNARALVYQAQWVLAFAGLDGGVLIPADQPGSAWQEPGRLNRGIEHRAGAPQEDDGIRELLPEVRPPGAKTFRLEPAPHRTRWREAAGSDLEPCAVRVPSRSSQRVASGAISASDRRWP